LVVPSPLENVVVVLNEPRNPINIGATVRAMANTGLGQLRLVKPVEYDPSRIEAIAHGTRERAAKIRTSTRLTRPWPTVCVCMAYVGKPRAARWARTDPKASANELLGYAAGGPVAILFGPEDRGLENEALDRAHSTVTIPTTTHSSLNLAQAVLIAGYELHIAAGDSTRRLPRPRHDAPAGSHEQFERTYATLAKALTAIDFFKTRNPELVMRSVRSLVYRAGPDARELDLARAIAIEVLRTIDRVQGIYRGGYGKMDEPERKMDE